MDIWRSISSRLPDSSPMATMSTTIGVKYFAAPSGPEIPCPSLTFSRILSNSREIAEFPIVPERTSSACITPPPLAWRIEKILAKRERAAFCIKGPKIGMLSISESFVKRPGAFYEGFAYTQHAYFRPLDAEGRSFPLCQYLLDPPGERRGGDAGAGGPFRNDRKFSNLPRIR